MIDVKKLITGFLILAAAAVFSGVVLSLINFSSAPRASAPTPSFTDSATSSNGLNAFFPQESTSSLFIDTTSTTATTSSQPGNLTDAVASSFVNEAISANPNGVTEDASGKPTLTNNIDPSILATDVLSSNSSTLQGITVPDWNVEAASQPIHTVSSSQASITSYANALNGIFEKYFVSTNLEDLLASANADSSNLPFVESQIKSALSDTIALKVPASLAGFQKALIKSMVYEKNEAALTAQAGNDPMKTALILQAEQTQYIAVMNNLQRQMQSASSLGLLFNGKGGGDSVPFIAQLFGVQPAHALFGLGDITFDPSVFMQLIANYARSIALQILKNTLIALIQNKVLAWVQGSGTPRFVQNWLQTSINAYTQSALSYIDNKMACGTYASYLPMLQVTLNAFYTPDQNYACANDFAAALGSNSLQEFLGDFSHGGFLAYSTMLLPSGNPYSALFFNAQNVAFNADNAQQANQSQNVASVGFTAGGSASYCDDGSNPSGYSYLCKDSSGAYNPSNSASCPSGQSLVKIPNNGQCTDGTMPSVNTPGYVTGLAVKSALDSSPKLVTAANDIVGIIGSVAVSLLNNLANMAVNAGTNAINSGLQGAPPSNPPATPAPAPLPLACNPITQYASTTIAAMLSATGGTQTSDGLVTYSWLSSDGQTSTGYTFSPVYSTAGTYTITLSDTTGDPSATCTVIVQ